jgi:hypothetical protein
MKVVVPRSELSCPTSPPIWRASAGVSFCLSRPAAACGCRAAVRDGQLGPAIAHPGGGMRVSGVEAACPACFARRGRRRSEEQSPELPWTCEFRELGHHFGQNAFPFRRTLSQMVP